MMLIVPSVSVSFFTITIPMPQHKAEKRMIIEPLLTSIHPGLRIISIPLKPANTASQRLRRILSLRKKTAAIAPNMVLVKLNAVALASSTTLNP